MEESRLTRWISLDQNPRILPGILLSTPYVADDRKAGRFQPVMKGCFGSRLCENVLEQIWQSESERKSRSYVKFTSVATPKFTGKAKLISSIFS